MNANVDQQKYPVLNVAILGAGNIAGPYAEDIAKYPYLKLLGVFDLDGSKAAELAAKHRVDVYISLEAMLSDADVDIVVNLSAHHAHFELTKRCLEAGKHLHSEKPLALTSVEAWKLIRLAETKALKLSCSPFTWMGNASRALRTLIGSGKIGEPKMIYAEVNWGFIETWHPSPASFHAVGSLWDVGVYPLSLITSIFGPACAVQTVGKCLQANRITRDGQPFKIDSPDWMVSIIDFKNNVSMRLTTSFYVGVSRQRATLEVHGDSGTIRMDDWLNFDGNVEFSTRTGEWESVEFEKGGDYIRWGLAVSDLARAITEDRPPLASGSQAAHVVDILEACEKSAMKGNKVGIDSIFPAIDEEVLGR